MKEYSKGIYVKFKPEEVDILHNRMQEAGVRNMSAYIRKMALNGYVIIPEWPDLNQIISLHSRISNNLNQYARLIITILILIISILSYQEVKKHHYGWDTMDFNDNVRKDFNYG